MKIVVDLIQSNSGAICSWFAITDPAERALAMGLFDLMGISTNPWDLRALSTEEMINMQISQNAAARQAAVQATQYGAMQNWLWTQRSDEKPLDERFADFKKRLAAAIEKRRAF